MDMYEAIGFLVANKARVVIVTEGTSKTVGEVFRLERGVHLFQNDGCILIVRESGDFREQGAGI